MIKKLGRYEILGVLGRGSMGVVYKGVDRQIDKLVAIKTMNPKVLKQKDMQERFYREGTILGQLNHKNIISVHNVGVDGDVCYIAMEFLEGTSLDRLLQQRARLSTQRSLEIIMQVCDGVNAAHRQSVIHRDLKPANIFLIEEDYVKVLDFGVAHFQNSQLTNSGMLLGTINYIAPEQITGLKVDYRADIFSIGVILYEMLSGKNPFIGKNISQTMVKIVNESPPPLAGIPPKLQEVLNKALHKDRNRRYISTKLMASDINQVLRKQDLSETRPASSGDGNGDLRQSRNQILNKMIQERVDAIKGHIRREELEQAENMLSQLVRLDKNHASIADLKARLEKARKRGLEKKHFVEQLTHDTLLKANEKMADRHYVAAVELCQKVLKVDSQNQDAKVIKANSIRKLEHFLSQLKREDP